MNISVHNSSELDQICFPMKKFLITESCKELKVLYHFLIVHVIGRTVTVVK